MYKVDLALPSILTLRYVKATMTINYPLLSKLRSCSVIYLILGAFFFLSFASQLLLSQSLSHASSKDQLSASAQFTSSNQHDISHPFSLTGIPESSENGDQDERDDRVEDEFLALSITSPIAELNSTQINSNIIHFIRIIENKSQPSLYMLYHSWKSFLA